MLRAIVLKEIRDLIGSTKFAITFGVSATLIILSFYVGAADFKLARTQYEASQAENLRQMSGLTDWFGVEQHRVFLPPSPLSALVTGISNDIGRTTEVKTQGELVPEGSRFGEDPFLAVFQFLDLGFIFQIVLSLFAIMLGYDAISGEKERGTLRLAFANAVPRSIYILGKLIGSFAGLALSLLVAIGIGCLLLPVLSVSLSSGEWIRLGLIIGAGLLYFGAFLTLSLFVSSATQRTSSSFLFLLVIWVGSVLIIPRVSVMLAAHSVDVSSVDELASQKASFRRELSQDMFDALENFETPPAPEESDNPQGDMESMMATFEQYMDSVREIRQSRMDAFTNRLNEGRQNSQQVQERLAFGLARVSPTASLSLLICELAGTSIALKNRYAQEVASYRQKFADFMKEKTGSTMGGGHRVVMWSDKEEEEEAPEPINLQELPEFEHRDASLSESINAAALDFGLLAFFNLLFFVGAFTAFLRYDLR